MTTLTNTSMRSVAGTGTTKFYFYLALSCAAIAFIGFAPTYWMPMASKTLRVSPVIHVHGTVFFAWSLFLVFQTWLASSGQIARHRSVGMIGVSLATAMTIFGTFAAINVMKQSAAIGMRAEGIAFAIVPLSGIAFFAVVFTLAIVNVRRSDFHKRLMLLAAISILDAAIARWFLTFLAPPGAVGPPPVAVTIPPAMISLLLVVVALVYDWRTRGRPHPVWVIGGGAMLLIKLLNLPISNSGPWQAFAGGILALAQ
jgi:hypothetical protein